MSFGLCANLFGAKMLVRRMETIAMPLGYHVALGGGCIHQSDERKDIDVILYRRRMNRFDGTCCTLLELFAAWEKGMADDDGELVFVRNPDYDLEKNTWCMKALWHGIAVDVLYPESEATECGYIRQKDQDDFKGIVLTS